MNKDTVERSKNCFVGTDFKSAKCQNCLDDTVIMGVG